MYDKTSSKPRTAESGRAGGYGMIQRCAIDIIYFVNFKNVEC